MRIRTTTARCSERDGARETAGAIDSETLLLVADLLDLCLRRCDSAGNSADALEAVRATLVAWAGGTLPWDIAHRNLAVAYDAMRRVGRDSPAGRFDQLLDELAS